MYLSWAVLYEGASDRAYLDVLLPRIMEDVICSKATRTIEIPVSPSIYLARSTADKVAAEICEAKEAFELLFIHSDSGGRGLQETLDHRSTAFCQAAKDLCGWSMERCVRITPSHEIEAWLLADPAAVQHALGYRGNPNDLGLPRNAREAERLTDPKETIANANRQARGRRSAINSRLLYSAIAQRQSLSALRNSASFNDFENRLTHSLAEAGFLVR